MEYHLLPNHLVAYQILAPSVQSLDLLKHLLNDRKSSIPECVSHLHGSLQMGNSVEAAFSKSAAVSLVPLGDYFHEIFVFLKVNDAFPKSIFALLDILLSKLSILSGLEDEILKLKFICLQVF